MSAAPALAFRAGDVADGSIAVRVNFGVYAGRNATQAEMEDLARELRTIASSFAIVAEDRHEFGGASETAVRQIVVEIHDGGGTEREALARRTVALAEQWAASCIRTRADLGELGDAFAP